MSPRRANLGARFLRYETCRVLSNLVTQVCQVARGSPLVFLFTIFDVSISLRLHADAEPVTDISTMGEVKRLLGPTILRSRSGKARTP